ncbi:MAG: IS200/IS605 family transposase [Deltaproteobacteria bacterium]|nr:IS200/IS605 family transposase [Deltaproteobacteria bacterium]
MSQRSIATLVVHIVWSTLERRLLLPHDLDPLLRHVLSEKATVMRSPLIASGCASDHVHVVAKLHPTVPLADLVQRMKGASAYELSRSRHWPVPLRWQEGYWAESVTPSSVPRLAEYVESQRTRHEGHALRERWMTPE